MESKKTFFDITESGSSQHTLESSTNSQILTLEKEINVLKRTIAQLKQELDANQHKSGNDNDKKSSHESNADIIRSNEEGSVVRIKSELYEYGGTYCMDVNNKQLVIGFNSSLTKLQKPEYAIEFLKDKQQVKVGKWVMPMSITLEKLKSEVMLHTVKDIKPFIKNCKHHIDCHTDRLQQYKELKSCVENLRNINVQTNLGYTEIILELLNVFDKKNNCYFNISIYLWYKPKRTRPHEIKFEISGKVNYDTIERTSLQKSFKVFRTNVLKLAFTNILTEDNPQFKWKRKEKSDNECITDLQESDSMDEGEKKKERRKGVKKRLRKRNEQKKKKHKSDNASNEKDMFLKKIKELKSSQVPLRPKKTIHLNKSTYQTALNKCSFKLRSSQTKQEATKSVESNFNIKPLSIKLSRLKVYSSTPLRQNPSNRTPFEVLPSLDISNINASSNSEQYK